MDFYLVIVFLLIIHISMHKIIKNRLLDYGFIILVLVFGGYTLYDYSLGFLLRKYSLSMIPFIASVPYSIIIVIDPAASLVLFMLSILYAIIVLRGYDDLMPLFPVLILLSASYDLILIGSLVILLWMILLLRDKYESLFQYTILMLLFMIGLYSIGNYNIAYLSFLASHQFISSTRYVIGFSLVILQFILFVFWYGGIYPVRRIGLSSKEDDHIHSFSRGLVSSILLILIYRLLVFDPIGCIRNIFSIVLSVIGITSYYYYFIKYIKSGGHSALVQMLYSSILLVYIIKPIDGISILLLWITIFSLSYCLEYFSKERRDQANLNMFIIPSPWFIYWSLLLLGLASVNLAAFALMIIPYIIISVLVVREQGLSKSNLDVYLGIILSFIVILLYVFVIHDASVIFTDYQKLRNIVMG